MFEMIWSHFLTGAVTYGVASQLYSSMFNTGKMVYEQPDGCFCAPIVIRENVFLYTLVYRDVMSKRPSHLQSNKTK